MSRKKPIRLKKLEGTYRRKPGKHPLSPEGYPEMKPMELKKPPEWIGKYGKEYWKRVAPFLIRLGLLTTIDRGAFEILCSCYNQARETRDLLEKEGWTVEDERKLPRKNPLWQVHRESTKQYFTMAAEFGLQPGGRSKLDIDLSNLEDDELEQYLGRKKTRKGSILEYID